MVLKRQNVFFHSATSSSGPGAPHYREIHAPGGIRTRNPIKRTVAESRRAAIEINRKKLTVNFISI
jgi:hypothetical protein